MKKKSSGDRKSYRKASSALLPSSPEKMRIELLQGITSIVTVLHKKTFKVSADCLFETVACHVANESAGRSDLNFLAGLLPLLHQFNLELQAERPKLHKEERKAANAALKAIGVQFRAIKGKTVERCGQPPAGALPKEAEEHTKVNEQITFWAETSVATKPKKEKTERQTMQRAFQRHREGDQLLAKLGHLGADSLGITAPSHQQAAEVGWKKLAAYEESMKTPVEIGPVEDELEPNLFPELDEDTI